MTITQALEILRAESDWKTVRNIVLHLDDLRGSAAEWRELYLELTGVSQPQYTIETIKKGLKAKFSRRKGVKGGNND
jgi:hypothetical protein